MITSARVDIEVANNGTWEDAFQFDDPADLSWNLSGQSFRMDIKGNRDQTVALLTLSTAAGTIVIDDVTQRVIHMNVPDTTITASLLPGKYVYDLIMFDGSAPPVRIPLMHGEIHVKQGITGN